MINPRKYPFTFLINNNNNNKISLLSKNNNELLFKLNFFTSSLIELKFYFYFIISVFFISYFFSYLLNPEKNFEILFYISLFSLPFILVSFFLHIEVYKNISYLFKRKKINKIKNYLENKQNKELTLFMNFFKNININIFNHKEKIIIKDIKEKFLIKINKTNKTDEEKELFYKTIFIENFKNINKPKEGKFLLKNFYIEKLLKINKILKITPKETLILENKPKEKGILYKDVIKDKVKTIKIND